MELLKVLTRNKVARTIDFECPHCQKRATLNPAVVTKLEDGIDEVSGWCPACRRSISVNLRALGGYLWTPASPGQEK